MHRCCVNEVFLLFLQCPKSSKYRQDSPVPAITSSTPTLLTDHNNTRVSPSLCSTSTPCTHDSRVDPGQKDPSSINVSLTLDQFRQLQDEVATCHQRLKEEEDKRRKMELKLTKVRWYHYNYTCIIITYYICVYIHVYNLYKNKKKHFFKNERVCRDIKTQKAQEQDWDGTCILATKLNTTST